MRTSQATEIKELLTKLSEIVNNTHSDVAVLKSHVMGNGNRGLTARVDELEASSYQTKGGLNTLKFLIPLSIAAASLLTAIAARF